MLADRRRLFEFRGHFVDISTTRLLSAACNQRHRSQTYKGRPTGLQPITAQGTGRERLGPGPGEGLDFSSSSTRTQSSIERSRTHSRTQRAHTYIRLVWLRLFVAVEGRRFELVQEQVPIIPQSFSLCL